MPDLTHADLVSAAERWLRGTRRGRVVMTERAAASYEEPDAIGWQSCGSRWSSVLVECKVSRGDFLADRKKLQRQEWTMGMGQERWYLTPPGLLKPADLPERWGLLETNGARVRVVVKATEPDGLDLEVLHREAPLLLSELARMQADGLGLVMAAVRRMPKGDLMTVHMEAGKRLERVVVADPEPEADSNAVA